MRDVGSLWPLWLKNTTVLCETLRPPHGIWDIDSFLHLRLLWRFRGSALLGFFGFALCNFGGLRWRIAGRAFIDLCGRFWRRSAVHQTGHE
jgi:hypothetical protein